MKLRFIKANPSGNTTVFILDPVERSRYGEIARKIMTETSVGAEQVGYIYQAKDGSGWAMEMMGGEFCGNASRSFAAWKALHVEGENQLQAFAEAERDEVLRVSGASSLLTAHLKNLGAENRVYATVSMPLPVRIRHGKDAHFGSYSLVEFEGISHIACWEKQPADNDVAEAERFLTAQGADPSCFGLLYVDEAQLRMTPLVYVGDAGTLVWENSCGSGTCALASALADRTQSEQKDLLVQQPGGALTVSASFDNGTVTELILGGVIEFTALGELYLED